MKIVTVIQARSGSTRLPGKIMLPLADAPLLVRMYERINRATLSGTVVIATTTSGKDDIIETLCRENNFLFYRGDEFDLLDRHYKTGIEFKADVIVKIPSDCPLIDSFVIDRVIKYFLSNRNKFDFVSNLHPASYPDGNDVEVIPMNILEVAQKEAKIQMEREHTTPFIWDNPSRFRIGNVKWETRLDYSMSHRFTIDYPEDYEFIKRVYDELYPVNSRFGLREIITLLKKKPEIKKINEKYCGVNWYRNHLKELKTITKEQTKSIDN